MKRLEAFARRCSVKYTYFSIGNRYFWLSLKCSDFLIRLVDFHSLTNWSKNTFQSKSYRFMLLYFQNNQYFRLSCELSLISQPRCCYKFCADKKSVGVVNFVDPFFENTYEGVRV